MGNPIGYDVLFVDDEVSSGGEASAGGNTALRAGIIEGSLSSYISQLKGVVKDAVVDGNAHHNLESLSAYIELTRGEIEALGLQGDEHAGQFLVDMDEADKEIY
ncbi:MAG: hypothetical protein LBR44_11245 [Clostridiales Family XIII bacterium]|jgi:hypothetical protein|nr:hypothetical protein [Clostridiales Family XIII bacterium]